MLNLPIDYNRPGYLSFEGNSISFTINKIDTAALKKLAIQEGVTIFMLLLAVYNVFLAKICRQETIVVGIPIAGRRHIDLEQIIGMFVNVIAIKSNPQKNKSFVQFLAEVKENALNAYENQEYQFEELVSKTRGTREQGRDHIVETHFVFEKIDPEPRHRDNNETNTETNNDTTIESSTNTGTDPHFEITGNQDKGNDVYELQSRISRLDLSLIAAEAEESITVGIQYRTNLFKSKTIEEFCRCMMNIVKSVIKNSNILLGDIDMLSDEEKNRIVSETQDNRVIFSQLKGVEFNEVF